MSLIAKPGREIVIDILKAKMSGSHGFELMFAVDTSSIEQKKMQPFESKRITGGEPPPPKEQPYEEQWLYF